MANTVTNITASFWLQLVLAFVGCIGWIYTQIGHENSTADKLVGLAAQVDKLEKSQIEQGDKISSIDGKLDLLVGERIAGQAPRLSPGYKK